MHEPPNFGDMAFAVEALDELVEALDHIEISQADFAAITPALAKAWAALIMMGLRTSHKI